MAAATRIYDAYLDVAVHATDRVKMAYWAAELSWLRAQLEKTRRRAAVLWQRTADRFDRVIGIGGADPKMAASARKAANLARRNHALYSRP